MAMGHSTETVGRAAPPGSPTRPVHPGHRPATGTGFAETAGGLRRSQETPRSPRAWLPQTRTGTAPLHTKEAVVARGLLDHKGSLEFHKREHPGCPGAGTQTRGRSRGQPVDKDSHPEAWDRVRKPVVPLLHPADFYRGPGQPGGPRQRGADPVVPVTPRRVGGGGHWTSGQ